ncbi:MAG: choice-of-anchor D domain-containing protein [Planctomycetes bacterium]|nr:choice-of-anchor D domain-containing protein [Planctomycetota bacterium]
MNYSVSSGALSSTYVPLSGATTLGLGYGGVSALISPTGFSFDYFGTNYTSFRIYASGYVVMGSASGTPSKPVNHASAVGNFISPLWGDYNPQAFLGTSSIWGEVGYTWSAGVLTVEWKDIPSNANNMVGVRMQAVLNTGNDTIEFRYGQPSGGGAFTNTSANACAISGPNTVNPQAVVPGSDGTNVSSTGQVNTYPRDRFIRFTPAGAVPANNPPSISVSYIDASSTIVIIANNGTLNVPHGTTVSGLFFAVRVGDTDLDNCTLSATISNVGSTGLVTSEWESASTLTPYQIFPSSGTFDTTTGATHVFALVADDGTDTTPFTFTIVQAASGPTISVTAGGTAVTSGQAAAGTNREFANQDVGTSSAALTIAISNGGGSNLTVGTPTVGGASTEFTLNMAGFSGTVAPGTSTSFDVAFAPTSAGAKVAQLTLTNNAGADFIIEVMGTGTQPQVPAPLLVVRLGGATGSYILHGGSVDFGTLNLSQGTSVARTIFVQNAGTATLTLGTPASSGAEFTCGTLPATLAPNASATFVITYQPAAAGSHNHSVTFSHNDSAVTNPFRIDVSATAISGTTPPPTGGGSGLSGGGGGGGCASATGASGLLVMILALCAVMGVRTRRKRA